MITSLLLTLIGIINAAVFVKLTYAFRLLKMRQHDLSTNEAELPSVSVCIPARNEIHAMTGCLDRVVASTYPKLEIIVCDDGSRDDTSLLIKSYAAAGVRFVEGGELPEGWLGKNHAQKKLAHEASGTIVFFMDVDTMLRPHTISRAVGYMLGEKADMVSIIPLREDTWRASAVFATLRHFWTVIRFSAARPRAASNAWLVKRDVLLEQFEKDTSIPLSVQVETTIARTLAAAHKYRLVLSDQTLGLSYEKKWRSQCETSIRLLYPQCGSSVQALGLIATLSLLLVPYAMLVWDWRFAVPLIIIQYFVYRYFLSRVRVRLSFLAALFLPVILAQELVLLIVSTYKYHLGTITWKGRPVTIASDSTPKESAS